MSINDELPDRVSPDHDRHPQTAPPASRNLPVFALFFPGLSMLDRIRRLIGTTDPSETTAVDDRDDTPLMDHHDARRAQLDGAILIDVRETDEWQAGHIADALHCSLPRLASDPELDVPAEATLITYCKVGARAERAAEILKACGHGDVRVMTGGYADWAAAGYPTG